MAPPVTAVLAIDGPIDSLVRQGVLQLLNVRTDEMPVAQSIVAGHLHLDYPSGVRWNDVFRLVTLSDVVRSKFGGRLAMGEQVSQTNYAAIAWTLPVLSGTDTIDIVLSGVVGGLTYNYLPPFRNNSKGQTVNSVAIAGGVLNLTFPSVVDPGDIIELPEDSFGVTDDAGNPIQNGTQIGP